MGNKQDNQTAIIVSHDFSDAKKELKKINTQNTTKITLSTVKEKTGAFKHKVRGEELNTAVAEIQKALIISNQMDRNFLKQFQQLYKALDALDNDYINAIQKNFDGLVTANEDIKKQQSEIDNTVYVQKKTVDKLVEFKQRIENIENLKAVDDIWDYWEYLKVNIPIIIEQTNGNQHTIGEHSKHLIAHDSNIEKINNDISVIDLMIENIKESIKGNEQSISDILVSLNETDKEINTVEQNLKNTDSEVEKNSQAISSLQKSNADIMAVIDSFQQSTKKKIGIAYTLAGCGLGIAIVELVLNVMGII